MKNIFLYIKDYYKSQSPGVFFFCALLTAVGIYVNYHFHLNSFLSQYAVIERFFCWAGIFFMAFGIPYLVIMIYSRRFRPPLLFFVLLFLSPFIFAWKMVYDIRFSFAVAPFENNFWNHVIYWPFKLAVITGVLFIVWKLSGDPQRFYGTGVKNMKWQPYLIMLLVMIPLIALASTQKDFLAVYPKFQSVSWLTSPHSAWWHKLLYELSYGTDFLTIEFFFRGFLVLAFARWFGPAAILPMACFYCSIHFGKPLGECISSFFGGILLGIITYRTRNIFGGLIVHLGIAWMMELGGYVGQIYFS